MEHLMQLMIRHGACIRAIPKEIKHVVDARHACEYPQNTGKIVYLPEYKREMFVFFTKPEYGGKIIVDFAPHTSADVTFHLKHVFSSLEEVEDFLESLN